MVKSMNNTTLTLLDLPKNKTARIIAIDGGREFQRKLCVMGIREGELVKLVSKQPMNGPLTIQACGCQMTLGRGMARKITVEVTS